MELMALPEVAKKRVGGMLNDVKARIRRDGDLLLALDMRMVRRYKSRIALANSRRRRRGPRRHPMPVFSVAEQQLSDFAHEGGWGDYTYHRHDATPGSSRVSLRDLIRKIKSELREESIDIAYNKYRELRLHHPRELSYDQMRQLYLNGTRFERDDDATAPYVFTYPQRAADGKIRIDHIQGP